MEFKDYFTEYTGFNVKVFEKGLPVKVFYEGKAPNGVEMNFRKSVSGCYLIHDVSKIHLTLVSSSLQTKKFPIEWFIGNNPRLKIEIL